MADPVLPDHFRAMLVLQGASGLPEDRYVNSFVFRNVGLGASEGLADRVKQAMIDFYTVPRAPSVNAVGRYMSLHQMIGAEVRVYDLGDDPPRTPLIRDVWTEFDAVTQLGAALPYEVSVCLSLRTAERSRRGRGRIYLGPLTTGALTDSPIGPVVTPAFRDSIRDAANHLAGANGQDLEWHILSQVDGTPRNVIGGYVDDAFDTQRRRGSVPSERTTFGTVV